MKLFVARSVPILLLALPALAAAVGPAGTLYLTANEGSLLVTLRGRSENYFTTAFGDEGPIAVYDDVRTTGTDYRGVGTTYDLDCDFVGGAHANAVQSGARDATTDGDLNYVLDDSGAVFFTDRNFDTSSFLFSTGTSGGGIAYDPEEESLWVAGDGFMSRYDRTGNLLGVFALDTVGTTALAFDPTDGTLWTGNPLGGGSLLTQYSTSGTILQTYALSSGLDIVGMEFNLAPVPEPASFLVLGLGAAPLFARRRRLRS